MQKAITLLRSCLRVFRSIDWLNKMSITFANLFLGSLNSVKVKGEGKSSSEAGRRISRKTTTQKVLDAGVDRENIVRVHSENLLHYFILSRNVKHYVYFNVLL